ncbi:MAG TPA: M20/M25/M40 family metallo-hydrolase [Gemmatimonadaceae bacterium]|nr:M20/M25/M40 family metallo-hydrolase [Gemmatimonadaceae bacterium]
MPLAIRSRRAPIVAPHPSRSSHVTSRLLVACALALALVLSVALPAVVAAQDAAPSRDTALAARYRAAADRLTTAALADSSEFGRLTTLVDRFGSRFSGTPSLESAIDWILAEMRADGLENVHAERVMVPHWVRGEESAELLSPRRQALPMLGLGGSIGTPQAGITAPVLVVTSFDDLQRRAAEARGKIVLFDVPFTSYGETVRYRTAGAVAAARVGAVASLVRSITPFALRTPHAGNMHYDSTVRHIPTAAITVEDAMLLHRMQDRGERVVVRLRMSARTLAPAPSRNVVAELRGTEHPEQVVVLGGHIDSWDVGQGAMDDGGGAVAAWQAVLLMKRLGLRPHRTVRVVLWTNEENGVAGGRAYRDAHRGELAQHILAMETDNGVFTPHGFGFTGSEEALAIVRQMMPLLAPLHADSVIGDADDADIDPLVAEGVPGIGLRVDGSRYFWYHHTEADTIDKLDPHEMAMCTAVMAIVAYVAADMPQPLPHGAPPGTSGP